MIQTENPQTTVLNDGINRLSEWFLLPGILWRHHVLYNELPPSDSWMWKHYPDGDSWKKAIEKMGFPDALYRRISMGK